MEYISKRDVVECLVDVIECIELYQETQVVDRFGWGTIWAYAEEVVSAIPKINIICGNCKHWKRYKCICTKESSGYFGKRTWYEDNPCGSFEGAEMESE